MKIHKSNRKGVVAQKIDEGTAEEAAVSIAAEIDGVLEQAQNSRHQSVLSDDLVALKIPLVPKLIETGEDFQVIRSRGGYHVTTGEQVERFIIEEDWPEYSELKCTELGMVLAGGAITTIITSEDFPPKDYDFFLVNLTEQKARENIAKFAHRFTHNSPGSVHVYRTQEVLTLVSREITVQIILRRYSSIAQVLHGFDLGPCQVAVFAGQLVGTPMAQYCYNHRCVLPALYARRPSFEQRLLKYFDRGFDLVLPHCPLNQDIDRCLVTPYLKVSITSDGYGWARFPSSNLSSYDGGYRYHSKRMMVRNNLKRIQQGKEMVASAPFQKGMDLFTFSLEMSNDEILKALPSPGNLEYLGQIREILGAERAEKIAPILIQHLLQYQSVVEFRRNFSRELAEYLLPELGSILTGNCLTTEFHSLDDVFTIDPITFAEWYGL